jgi:hypothetical protein
MNNLYKEYPIIDSIEFYNSTCYIGNFTKTSYKCTDTGYIINHQCKGYYDTLSSKCPPIIEISECLIINIPDNIASISSCQSVSFNSTSTTCSCLANSNNRKLNENEDIIIDQISIIGIVSMSKITFGEFEGTKTSSISTVISIEELLEEKQIYLMLGIFWLSSISIIFICFLRHRNSSSVTKLKNSKDLYRLKEMAKNSKSPIQVKLHLINYIDSIFPTVFSTKFLYSRIYEEIIKNHRYVKFIIATERSGDLRVTTGAHIITIISILMLVLSFFYEIQNPFQDDDVCINFISQLDCLKLVTAFDSTQSYCQWNKDTNQCNYNSMSLTWISFGIIGAIVSFISSFINLLIDPLFKILSTPTSDSVKKKLLFSSFNQKIRHISPLNTIEHKKSYNNNSFSTSSVRHVSIDSNIKHAIAISSITNLQHIIEQYQMEYNNRIHRMKFESINRFQMNPNDQGLLDVLLNDICLQRVSIKSFDLKEFDSSWDKLLAGDILSSRFTQINFLFISEKVKKRITHDKMRNELYYIDEESKRLINKYYDSSKLQLGLEILFLFISDLLGRNSAVARIFQTKFDQDFYHIREVTLKMKSLVWFVVLLINLLCIYVCLVQGSMRNKYWQISYIKACGVQITVEIIFFEMLESLWVHFIIPNQATDEIRKAYDIVNDSIEEICDINSNNKKKRYFLNAPSYLFISTKVANKFPFLLESLIVNSYHNHHPNYLNIEKKHHNRNDYSNSNSITIRFAVFNIWFLKWISIISNRISVSISTFLQTIGLFPVILQQLVIRIFLPIFFLFISWIFNSILIGNMVMIYGIIIVVILIFFLIYIYYLKELAIVKLNKKNKAIAVSPLINESSNDLSIDDDDDNNNYNDNNNDNNNNKNDNNNYNNDNNNNNNDFFIRDDDDGQYSIDSEDDIDSEYDIDSE